MIGGAAVAVVATAGVALSLGTAGNSPKKDDHTAGAQGGPTPNPTKTEQAGNQEKLTVKNVEIKAGLSDEAFAKALFEDKFTLWLMAGANDKTDTDFITYKLQPQPDGSTEQPPTSGFVVPLAEDEAQVFESALYVDGFTDTNGTLTYHVDENAGDLEAFLLTYKSDDPRDKEAYNHTLEVSGVSGTDTKTGRTIKVDVVEHDNAANNRIGSKYASMEPTKIEGNKLTYDITTQVVGGVEKIVSENIEK